MWPWVWAFWSCWPPPRPCCLRVKVSPPSMPHRNCATTAASCKTWCCAWERKQATKTCASPPKPNDWAPPDIFGVNNAKRGTQNEWDSGNERQSGEVGYGSDILVLRYQTSSA